MQGWIIYNGNLRSTKIEELVVDMVLTFEDLGVELTPIANNQILIGYDNDGNRYWKLLIEVPEPDFIVFWDKDIYLAQYLEKCGYRLYNCARAIEVCDSKDLTYLELANQGIRMARTFKLPMVYYDYAGYDDYLRYILSILGERIILKQSKGSFGMQVKLVEGIADLEREIAMCGNCSIILQEYIEGSSGRDIRVNIVGDMIVGAMLRCNEGDYRANITLGGRGEPYILNDYETDMALRAHKALGLDYSGVDILFMEQGERVICEVNSNVNYLSFDKVMGESCANHIYNHIMKDMRADY